MVPRPDAERAYTAWAGGRRRGGASGHDIQFQKPQVVIDAAGEVVDAVRAQTRAR